MFDHRFIDKDRDLACDAQGDCVGGAGVDFDLLGGVVGEVEGGVEGAFDDVGDGDGVECCAELFDGVGKEVVGHGPPDFDAGESAVDGDGFGDADDDGE